MQEQAGESKALPAATAVDPSGRALYCSDRLPAADGVLCHRKFEDRRTPAISNRRLKLPGFSVSIKGGMLRLQTQQIAMEYSIGEPVSPTSLSVQS